MSKERAVLEKTIGHALTGKDAHVETARALEGLDWSTAGERPDGAPHSIFQLLNHMIYWQEWVIEWLDGSGSPIPEHAAGSWPGSGAPKNEDDWEQTVARFLKGVDELRSRSRQADLLAKRGKRSRLEMLQTIASHNSYHIGQVVLLRQILGAWPPPSGGLTW